MAYNTPTFVTYFERPTTVLTIIAPLLIIIAIGVLFRRFVTTMDASYVRSVIGALVMNVFLPALSFLALYKTPLDSRLWQVPLVSVLTALGALFCAIITYRVFRTNLLSDSQRGSVILASVWCNATYLGLPIVTASLGQDLSQVPLLFDMAGMSPLLFSVGAMVGVRYGTRTDRHGWRDGIGHLVRLPPFIGAVAGLCAQVVSVEIPQVLVQAAEILGRCVAPLMMVSIGLALRPIRWRFVPLLGPALVIKLLVSPLLAFALLLAIGPESRLATAILLEAGMPTMMLTMVFAQKYGLDEALLAEAIVVSTVVSLFTLPVLAGAFGWP